MPDIFAGWPRYWSGGGRRRGVDFGGGGGGGCGGAAGIGAVGVGDFSRGGERDTRIIDGKCHWHDRKYLMAYIIIS